MNPRDIVNKYAVKDSVGNTPMTAFVVCKKKKTLFFHIAKTGGSTITNILQKHGLDDGVLTNKKTDYGTKLKHFIDIAENWDKYYKFTFVRNKFDQLVSLYHYDKHPGGHFDGFISNHVHPSQDIYGWWIDQYYLTCIGRKQLFDNVGYFDSFAEDFKSCLSKCGLSEMLVVGRKNVGNYDKSKPYGEYYNEQLHDIVYSKFRKEMEHFGWETN